MYKIKIYCTFLSLLQIKKSTSGRTYKLNRVRKRKLRVAAARLPTTLFNFPGVKKGYIRSLGRKKGKVKLIKEKRDRKKSFNLFTRRRDCNLVRDAITISGSHAPARPPGTTAIIPRAPAAQGHLRRSTRLFAIQLFHLFLLPSRECFPSQPRRWSMIFLLVQSTFVGIDWRRAPVCYTILQNFFCFGFVSLLFPT